MNHPVYTLYEWRVSRVLCGRRRHYNSIMNALCNILRASVQWAAIMEDEEIVIFFLKKKHDFIIYVILFPLFKNSIWKK